MPVGKVHPQVLDRTIKSAVQWRYAQAIGGYDETIKNCADWEFHIRAAQRFGWWYVPGALACYRIHQDSVTGQHTRSGTIARDLRKTIQRVELISPEWAARSRCVHTRNFSAQAAQAFHEGNPDLGYDLLRQALAFRSAQERGSRPARAARAT
jgi:hypothetical protein